MINKDDNNINKIMLHKTVDQDQTLSISTKVPQSKPASFLTTSKRHMYRSKAQADSKVVQSQICNMLVLQPQFASCVISDQAYFLQSGQTYMLVTDFHYCLISDRSKPIFIARNCDPGSELVFANIKKPGAAICLESVHIFATNQYPCMMQINLTKYNAGEINHTQSRDIYLQYESNYKLVAFMSVENSKKGLIVNEILPTGETSESVKHQKQYQFIYLSLLKPNKIKNTKYNSVAKQNIFSIKLNVQEQEQAQRPASTTSQLNHQNTKKQYKQYLYPAPQSIHQKIKLPLGEHIIKVINSQFGDAIIVCTNKQLYELEVQQTGIHLKPLHTLQKRDKFINKAKNNQKDLKQNKQDQDDIIDVGYVIDGLTLAFMTKSGIFALMEAQNVTCSKSVYQVLAQVNKKQQSLMKYLHMMSSKIVIQTDKAAVLVFKLSKTEIGFEKKIQLPVNNNDTVSYKVTVLSRNDELVLQRVNKKLTLNLQICIKSLLSGGNQFITIYTSDLEIKQHVKSMSVPKIVTSKANTISCILKDNSISFYKLNPQSSPSTSVSSIDGESSSKPIQFLFTKTLPQKPLYISIDPYSSNIIVLFREFIKFYKFCYHDIIQYYTYDVRNVNYAGYSQDGHTILVAHQDLLYFVNAYTYTTEYVMELYGDIKSVRLFDNIIYVLLKNKVSKHASQVLILQVYQWHNTDGFIKIYQNKLQPSEALLTTPNKFTICSQKQLTVYKIQGQQYPDEISSMSPNKKHKKQNIQISSTVTIAASRKIKLKDKSQYPTSVIISEEFGVVLVGTNYGRIYQYLWPFQDNDGDQNANDSYVLQCATMDIVRMQFTANYQKFYVYYKNGQITQHDIIQYIQCEQMRNIYIINAKTLHTPTIISSSSTTGEPHKLKYQFANRQYLYSKYTPYIFQDIRQTNQNIQELRFIYEKTKDDIEEFVGKSNQKIKQDVEASVKNRNNDVNIVRKQLQQQTKRTQAQIDDIKQKINKNNEDFKQTKNKQKQSYQKSLLQLYKQATRLRNIYNQLEHDQTRQRDVFLIENSNVMAQLKRQGEIVQEQFKQKFAAIDKNSEEFKLNQKDEAQKYIDKREDSRQNKFSAVCKELELEEERKQSLLSSNGYLMKQIANYNKRKDQFEALIMQTYLQIEQLHSDRSAYGEKIQYLTAELNKKQKTIEEKQGELIKLVGGASMMKKVKESHQFELKQYEKQFQPISNRMIVIDEQVKKMNGQILSEYLNKIQKDKAVIDNNKKLQRLKAKKIQQIQKKLQTKTKLERFLAQLELLLQDPMSEHLKDNLNTLSSGQKLMIDQQRIQQQIQSTKLLRSKLFIGKEISEQQKREQQIFRNKNQIIRHYNENTMLVREFNNLKQTGRKLQQMMKKAQLKYIAAKSMDMRPIQTPHQRARSQMDKKFSQKKLTPFQKHELQYNEMFKGGGTTQTKLTKSGQSLSLLKSLIKDVDGADSKYQKMQIVRDRIKSFVNPEIRIRKTLVTQRVLFERKKAESEYQV